MRRGLGSRRAQSQPESREDLAKEIGVKFKAWETALLKEDALRLMVPLSGQKRRIVEWQLRERARNIGVFRSAFVERMIATPPEYYDEMAAKELIKQDTRYHYDKMREQAEEAAQMEFVKTFIEWLQGKGPEALHSRTPWGRKAPALEIKEVREYLEGFLDMFYKTWLKLTLLVFRGPRTLKEYWVYYKFVLHPEDWPSEDPLYFLEMNVFFDPEFPGNPRNPDGTYKYPPFEGGDPRRNLEAAANLFNIRPHDDDPEPDNRVAIRRRDEAVVKLEVDLKAVEAELIKHLRANNAEEVARLSAQQEKILAELKGLGVAALDATAATREALQATERARIEEERKRDEEREEKRRRLAREEEEETERRLKKIEEKKKSREEKAASRAREAEEERARKEAAEEKSRAEKFKQKEIRHRLKMQELEGHSQQRAREMQEFQTKFEQRMAAMQNLSAEERARATAEHERQMRAMLEQFSSAQKEGQIARQQMLKENQSIIREALRHIQDSVKGFSVSARELKAKEDALTRDMQANQTRLTSLAGNIQSADEFDRAVKQQVILEQQRDQLRKQAEFAEKEKEAQEQRFIQQQRQLEQLDRELKESKQATTQILKLQREAARKNADIEYLVEQTLKTATSVQTAQAIESEAEEKRRKEKGAEKQIRFEEKKTQEAYKLRAKELSRARKDAMLQDLTTATQTAVQQLSTLNVARPEEIKGFVAEIRQSLANNEAKLQAMAASGDENAKVVSTTLYETLKQLENAKPQDTGELQLRLDAIQRSIDNNTTLSRQAREDARLNAALITKAVERIDVEAVAWSVTEELRTLKDSIKFTEKLLTRDEFEAQTKQVAESLASGVGAIANKISEAIEQKKTDLDVSALTKDVSEMKEVLKTLRVEDTTLAMVDERLNELRQLQHKASSEDTLQEVNAVLTGLRTDISGLGAMISQESEAARGRFEYLARSKEAEIESINRAFQQAGVAVENYQGLLQGLSSEAMGVVRAAAESNAKLAEQSINAYQAQMDKLAADFAHRMGIEENLLKRFMQQSEQLAPLRDSMLAGIELNKETAETIKQVLEGFQELNRRVPEIEPEMASPVLQSLSEEPQKARDVWYEAAKVMPEEKQVAFMTKIEEVYEELHEEETEEIDNEEELVDFIRSEIADWTERYEKALSENQPKMAARFLEQINEYRQRLRDEHGVEVEPLEMPSKESPEEQAKRVAAAMVGVSPPGKPQATKAPPAKETLEEKAKRVSAGMVGVALPEKAPPAITEEKEPETRLPTVAERQAEVDRIARVIAGVGSMGEETEALARSVGKPSIRSTRIQTPVKETERKSKLEEKTKQVKASREATLEEKRRAKMLPESGVDVYMGPAQSKPGLALASSERRGFEAKMREVGRLSEARKYAKRQAKH